MDWETEILPLIQSRLDVFKQHNIIPTLSIIFYYLVSIMAVSNSQRDYQNFKKYFYKARKTGKISLSNLGVNNHDTQFQPMYEKYIPLIDYINQEIARLESIPYIYARTIPRWHNQPHYVEMWIEKASLLPTFRNILKERQVRIILLNRYNYLNSLDENIRRLIYYKEQGKKLHINYFGDPNHFFKNIRDSYTENPKYFLDLDFKKISITQRQIKKFKLPENCKTINDTKHKKLNASSKSFITKDDRKNLKIELNTLIGVAPKEFKKIVLDSVDKYFDLKIFEKSINEYSPVEIRSKIKSQVLKFAKK